MRSACDPPASCRYYPCSQDVLSACAWDTKPEQSHQEDVPVSATSGRTRASCASSYYYALRKALGVIAAVQGWGQAAGTAMLANQAGAPQLAASSVKAALDLDWEDPAARDLALAQLLGLLDRVEAVIGGAAGSDRARACLQLAQQGP